jgi:hypothetical protein
MKLRPPEHTRRRDSTSSVAQIALLLALLASFSRARRSCSDGAASFFSSLPGICWHLKPLTSERLATAGDLLYGPTNGERDECGQMGPTIGRGLQAAGGNECSPCLEARAEWPRSLLLGHLGQTSTRR